MGNRERLSWSLVGLLVTTMLLGGGYQATNFQNGDVNGDGGIDVGDAVYLLAYLFQGGPEPEALRVTIPATGLTSCQDLSNPIPCGNPAFPGQDGDYLLGSSQVGRFVSLGDGTVLDQKTGLFWAAERCPNPVTWQQALQYAEALVLAGHDDWRLPNQAEAVTLMDYPKEPAALPDSEAVGQFFDLGDGTWTSSPWGNAGDDRAYHCDESNGLIFLWPKSAGMWARAVRGPVE